MLAANLTGKQIGDFILEDRIGRGGMAVVYRAFQSSVNRHVAVKIVPLDIDDEFRNEFSARFDQEANVIASLEHIHILPIYAYGILDHEYSYLVMRLMRGGTLADSLRNGPVPLERAVAIFTQIGRALQHAHDRGVIHRDLKPSNILLDEVGNAYLSDFGLAKVIEMSLDLTRSGNLVGTPAYVAPELVRGEIVTTRSDIYSLGVILYHILAGRPPFEQTEAGVLALLYRHVEEEPPPLRQINPDIPPAVEAIVMQALRKNPDERYMSAQAMVMDLDDAMGHKRSTISNPAIPTILPPPLHVIQRWRRNRMLWTMALVVALLIGGGFLLTQVTSQPRVATILPGERGTIETLIPSEAEVGLARERLGQTGFIAYIACTLNSVFQAGRARDIAEIAEEYGLAYRIYNSQSDTYTQITLIEQARLEGARAFILCPLSTDTLDETIASLQEANIPIVFTTLYDHPFGVKLDTDSYEIGLRMGRFAAEIIQEKWDGQATVLILAFPGFPASDLRTDGIEEAIRGMAPQASILPFEQGFTREEAYTIVREHLQQATEINVIMAINDASAFGAVDALQEADIPPDAVDIVSANAEPPALDLIEEGMYLRGTVAINREQLSRLAVFGIIKQLAGATVPELFSYPPGDMITAETLAAQFPE